MNGKALVAGLVTTVGLGFSLGAVLGEGSGSPVSQAVTQAAASVVAPAATASPSEIAFEADARSSECDAAEEEVVAAAAPGRTLGEDASGGEGDPTAEDRLYESLEALQSSGRYPAAAELDALLAQAFAAHDDWELQELAFAILREADPKGHQERILALARESTAPVGQLVGALVSADGLDPQVQDELLHGIARTQSSAIHGAADDDLETLQRRDLAEGAVGALVQRLPPSVQIEWLLAAQGIERRLLAHALDQEQQLVGPQGLSVLDARLLCDLLLKEGQGREDLSGWGPELELAARFPPEARDRAGWNALLERARSSEDGVVRSAAEGLLAKETMAAAR